MTITTGAITSTQATFNGSSNTYKALIAGYQMSGYNVNLPVYNPAGFFSIPMPGATVMYMQSPFASTGYTMGFANESPDPSSATNNISGLADGEAAICETSGFNFNITAKINQLLSTFTNSGNTTIGAQITIGQNVVQILTDLVAEIVALEVYVNTVAAAVPVTPPYVATANFTTDQTFLGQSPSQMYIDLNGELIP